MKRNSARGMLARLLLGGTMLAGAVVGAALPATAQAGEKAIKVGVLGDMSGYASSTGGAGAVLAAKLAAEDFGNAINGRPIEIVSADMQSKPDVAATIARQWFDRDAVDMIVDIPVSSVALAVQAVGREKHKVLITTGGLTTALTRQECSPWTIQLADDTSSLAQGTVRALAAQGLKKWFFITADFAFGTQMQADATKVLTSLGGSVSGSVRAPMGNADFSSFLLAAQASDADVVALANASSDTDNSVKQAGEFGLTKTKKLAALLMYTNDIESIGLNLAQGLYITDSFYWDANDASRAFAKRYFAQLHKMPGREQAYVYSGTVNYLRAVKAVGDDSDKVMHELRQTGIDVFGTHAPLRADGRPIYDVSVWQVKSPAESKYPWDYEKHVATVPAAQAFMPMDTNACKVAATLD